MYVIIYANNKTEFLKTKQNYCILMQKIGIFTNEKISKNFQKTT